MSGEGTIELRIDGFLKYVLRSECVHEHKWSITAYINGLSWEISALAFRSKALDVYLHCNEEDDDPNWSCQASFELRVVSQKTSVDDRIRQIVKTFSSDETVYEDEDFINCDVLLDPENGFIKDDVVILRAHVKAEMPQSAMISNLRAFASSISHSSDGSLVLGANKIPIHKTYLSYYSEYFKTMFESEFIEGRQHEIVLEEVGYVDMLQLLSVIYPFNGSITDKNLKVILKLADRFIMPAVMEQCKKQLKISTLTIAEKLLLAQQYNFKDLLVEFTQQCKKAEDVNELKDEPEYNANDWVKNFSKFFPSPYAILRKHCS